MVQLVSKPKPESHQRQEIRSELKLTLKQRQQINNPRIRQMLNNHLLDLQAELTVFGWP